MGIPYRALPLSHLSHTLSIIEVMAGRAMSEQSMVELVARAICSTELMNPDDKFGGWVHWTEAARAAIAAMREPTPDMISAAANTPGMAAVNALVLNVFARTGSDVLAGHNPVPLVQAWQAMIDAALADPTS